MATSIDQETKEYEIGFLVKEEAGIAVIRKFLDLAGAVITKEGEIKKISLAYPIKKETSAFFGFFHFTSLPAAIKDLEKELRVEPLCLRSIIIKDPIKRDMHREEGQPELSERGERVQQREPEEKPEAVKKQGDIVTNEELEKKLEEILQ